ncbi:protein FATTY ACID EXPORT 1, chloroplastic [Andrographis paniculata]|uniref:protein FATTY ACID EXPORT 1, chloroplastic n=1 Tax=Andrographis paniculata TaxID=175694 RepID=UPI0021E766F7|nr:protein FATTY ACID EXPORT 1, chloroplastic [Andrographis paniculata]
MSSVINQLSCFSSIANNRRLEFQFISSIRTVTVSFGPRNLKVLNVASNDGHSTQVSSLDNKTSPDYVEDASNLHKGSSIKSNSPTESFAAGGSNGHLQESVVTEPKRAAKIHDFCFGIPFGGLVLSGGLLGFIFTRNPATLGAGVLFGGALLALSTYSLKVWRKGKSSLPFILGQAVLSVALLWKNLQAYSMTKNLIPTGFNIVISAAMLCFYSYVVLSGGNPPPKKLKPSASVEKSS